MKKKMFLMFLAVIALMAAAAQADLRLWYNFEENAEWQAAGYVQDQSAYGNTGQLQEPWGYGLPTWVASHPGGGQAMQFGNGDGSKWNCIAAAKSASLANIGQAWAMGGWVKIDSVTGYDGYYSSYPKIISTPNYEVTGNAPGDDASYFWPWSQEENPWGTPGSWDMTTASVASYNGTWMHLIVTYDGTTFTQYINGDVVFTATDFAHPFDNGVWSEEETYWIDDPMLIGAALAGAPAAGGWLAGELDDIGIRSDYLDAADVASLYNGTDTWASIPEPATLILLGLGGLLLRKRVS